jgi:polyhydroxyalkanoate synthesis regulator phasin
MSVSGLYLLDTIDITSLINNGTINQEETEKLASDTFTSIKDTFEKSEEQSVLTSECYSNYQIKTDMPKSVFGDSYGYKMQKDIANHMLDYYAGKLSDDDLREYFNDCCTDMRIYRAGQHQTTGNIDDDSTQIVSEIYEIFAKENARAARNANYNEGQNVNKEYGGRNSDWAYYNADYYYQCENTNELLGTIANEVAEKWGIEPIDTKEIEANSCLTVDGGFDFNSGWNFIYRNQRGRANMEDESVAPPKDLKFFYKEMGTDDGSSKAIINMWIVNNRYSKEVSFTIIPDTLKGQIFDADKLMEDSYKQLDNAKEYKNFMSQISIFTVWYSRVSNIINTCGNYTPQYL